METGISSGWIGNFGSRAMFPTAREIFQTGEKLLPWTSIPFGRSNNISVWPILSIEHYLSIRMHYFSCILSISFIWIAAFPCVILIIFFLILEMNVSFKLFSSFWRFASSSRTKKSKRGNNKHVMWSLLPPSLHSLGGCFRDDSKRRSINDNIPSTHWETYTHLETCSRQPRMAALCTLPIAS